MLHIITKWFDNSKVPVNNSQRIDWLRIVPFLLLHLSCLLVFMVGISKTAVFVALFLYWLRLFAIGAFYHRYFSHGAFKTNRFWQCIFAILATSSAQRGPIWWAAHHREHHRTSDREEDPHSPWTKSFFTSHIGWFLSHKNFHVDEKRVRDLIKYPELRWIDRFDSLIPLGLLILLFGLGEILKYYVPSLHCTGAQLVVWGFSISTVAVLHTTLAVNSFGHKFGKQDYKTHDQSRNNLIIALFTLGEGWHNNHHRYPGLARQGLKWWQIDITYYLLLLMEKMHIIHDLKKAPKVTGN